MTAALFGKTAPAFFFYSLPHCFLHCLILPVSEALPGWIPIYLVYLRRRVFGRDAMHRSVIVGIAPNWRFALVVTSGYAAPALPFTGFSMPLDSMSEMARMFCKCLPLTWFIEVKLNSGHWEQKFGRWEQLLQRLRFSLLSLLLSAYRFFKWKYGKFAKQEKKFWRQSMNSKFPSLLKCFPIYLKAVHHKSRLCSFFLLRDLFFYSFYYCWPYMEQLPDHLNVVAVDQDNSALSRRLTQAMRASPSLLQVTSKQPACPKPKTLMRKGEGSAQS